MVVLRQKAFVVMVDWRYSFYDFKIACEGELKDIEEIDEVKQRIILHTRERNRCVFEQKKCYICIAVHNGHYSFGMFDSRRATIKVAKYNFY